MIINVKKTKVMSIATKLKLASSKKTSIDLFINVYELANVSEQMPLGITLTNDLKLNKNVDLLCKYVRRFQMEYSHSESWKQSWTYQQENFSLIN